MRIRFIDGFAIVLVIAFGLSFTGCAKRAAIADPLGNVTLVSPYTASVPPGEPTDKISIQYAVIAVARQAGIGYDWDTSYRNTDPTCRQWIFPDIRGRSFPQALEMILKPVNLTYTVVNGKIVLGRRL